jgi:F-type H+-transporting ATPase subunit b
VSVFDFFTFAEAWASTSAGEQHAPSFHQIWFPLGNFLIFAYIIHRFAFPLVRDFLRSRRQEILAAVQSAAEQRERADATVRYYKSRLANLDEEIKSIEASLLAEGEREKGKLVQETERIAGKIKEDSDFLSEQELKMARQIIREQMANDAAARTRELIKRHLSSDDHERLADDFIARIRDFR